MGAAASFDQRSETSFSNLLVKLSLRGMGRIRP